MKFIDEAFIEVHAGKGGVSLGGFWLRHNFRARES
jgi:GTPase involved in cell partitioning and DNA repair